MATPVVIHLLDATQGHPLQTWTFEDRDTITIGRSPENDVVITDPYVSRSHAYLKATGDGWQLIAISRQQILYQGETLSEMTLTAGTVFRLGPYGCNLRFGQIDSRPANLSTINFEPTLMPVFNLDREKMQSEVNQIAGGNYFQQLKNAARQLREQRQADDTRR